MTEISGYINKVMSDTTVGKLREKIVRIYNKDKKALNRDKMIEYLTKIIEKKKSNQNFRIRIYTDRGWRTIKNLSSDTFDWLEDEEYLRNRKEGSTEAFKTVFFVDLYQNTNI